MGGPLNRRHLKTPMEIYHASAVGNNKANKKSTIVFDIPAPVRMINKQQHIAHATDRKTYIS